MVGLLARGPWVFFFYCCGFSTRSSLLPLCKYLLVCFSLNTIVAASSWNWLCSSSTLSRARVHVCVRYFFPYFLISFSHFFLFHCQQLTIVLENGVRVSHGVVGNCADSGWCQFYCCDRWKPPCHGHYNFWTTSPHSSCTILSWFS